MFTCKQPNCFRDLLGLEKFRQHLKRNHMLDTLNNHSNENIDEIVTDELNLNVFDQHKVKSTIADSEETFNQNVNSKDGITFKDVVTSIILKCISNLYLKPNLTSLLIQNIIEEVSQLFSNDIISILKSHILPLLTNCSEKSEINDMFVVLENAFMDFKSEYLRIKYFETNNLFFKPKTIVVGHTKQKIKKSDVERLMMVPVQAHLLSLKTNLKAFFELPNVYETALNYTNNSINTTNVLTSFLNGTTWKRIRSLFTNKTVFPLFLYYDDCEMGNPLGSHSRIHKMGCVY